MHCTTQGHIKTGTLLVYAPYVYWNLGEHKKATPQVYRLVYVCMVMVQLCEVNFVNIHQDILTSLIGLEIYYSAEVHIADSYLDLSRFFELAAAENQVKILIRISNFIPNVQELFCVLYEHFRGWILLYKTG